MLHWTHSTKLQRYNTLIKNDKLKKYLPETAIYNIKNLQKYLNKYQSIYLKPENGTGGIGIVKLYYRNNKYILHFLSYKKIFNNFNAMFANLEKIRKGRKYLIQEGVELVTINNNPIDFRFLLLKPDKEWTPIGIMGKLGSKNKVVTNKSKGGKPILFDIALGKSLGLSKSEIKKIERKIYKLGIDVGDTLSKEYRYVREIGMDFAIDKNLNIFILETNAMPQFNLFKYHPDKTLYVKIYNEVKLIRRDYNNPRI